MQTKLKRPRIRTKQFWNIVHLESNKTDNTDKINILNINGIPISDCQKMANELNKYFSSVAKNINTKENKFSPYNVDNITPRHYLNQSFNNPLPKFNLKTVSTKEIKNIIKSLNPKIPRDMMVYLPNC